MVSSEYLAFIPLLIYGIALADLLSQWKRLLKSNQLFIPYLFLTIILTETAIYNVFVYGNLINQLAGQNYSSYLSYLLPPFLFMLTTNIFTPDQDSDTEEYFMKNMPVFLTIFSLFIASHFLYEFGESTPTIIVRVVGGILVFIAGVSRKKWIFYTFCTLWVFSQFVKSGMISS